MMDATVGHWHAALPTLVEAVADHLGLDDDAKTAVSDNLAAKCEEMVGEFADALGGMQQEVYISPIIRVVGMMPKDELAAMAESLVNLTSFKRKVTEDAETVGGPIDVAVISKGDGLIWIKRKHYFSRELNQQFFANYYRGGD